jgi:hypothetical protein
MMSEVKVVLEAEEQAGDPGPQTTTKEFKVQADDLLKAVKDLLHEGTVRRVTILRNDRVLVDIPVVAGLAVGVALATQLPLLSAIAAVGALAGGCTVRIEREEPPDEE